MKNKKYIKTIFGILSIICSLLICQINNLVIGWVIGFMFGIIGLLMDNKNKKEYKLGKILCLMGVILSLLNLILGLIVKY